MNKSTLATIFCAALLGIAKSKRYSLGSLGLKRNKPLEEFDKWLKESTERLMSYMENDSDFFEDLDWDTDLNAKLKEIDPQHLINAPITLMQNIAEYGLFQETPVDISLLKNIKNCKSCPEAWVYYLLYISITYDIGEDITSFSPDAKDRFSGDPILVSWEKFQKNAWQKEEVFGDSLVECRDYVELSIAQIDALKKISTLNEDSTSEKIILDLQNFLSKAEEKLKGVTIERSILATSIVGYCYIQILRFQISVASDKNIAEMAKKSFTTLLSKNSLQKFRIWGEDFWGFPDIPMGGLKLFSVGNLPSRHTRGSALRAAHMPLFGKMNYLDFYSMSIFKRISGEITDENFRKLRLLYSSRGISLDNRWKRNETLLRKG